MVFRATFVVMVWIWGLMHLLLLIFSQLFLSLFCFQFYFLFLQPIFYIIRCILLGIYGIGCVIRKIINEFIYSVIVNSIFHHHLLLFLLLIIIIHIIFSYSYLIKKKKKTYERNERKICQQISTYTFNYASCL